KKKYLAVFSRFSQKKTEISRFLSEISRFLSEISRFSQKKTLCNSLNINMLQSKKTCRKSN
ncbi:hypothetical protein, partial [Parabacteroides distasonis]|uniref:hypothetical protein n=1 Tax=Parabacteroides distasonis TaxID=823 RepID=UPI001CFFB869